MPNPQDVAVPSLPEPELPPLPATQLRFQVELTPTGERLDYTARDMNARYVEGYEAGRAAGRASAEPEGFVLVPREPTHEMVFATANGVTTVRDIYAAMLAAAATPTASIAPKGEAQRCTDCGDVVPKGACYCREGCVHAVGYDLAAPKAEGEAVVMGSTLQRVMARLANMLEENQFNEIESIVEDDGFAAPVAQAAAGASEPIRKLLAEVLLFFHDCSESIRCIDRVVDLEERIGDALARPEADADRASGGGV